VGTGQGVNLVIVAGDREGFHLAQEGVVPPAAHHLDVARLGLCANGFGAGFLVARGSLEADVVAVQRPAGDLGLVHTGTGRVLVERDGRVASILGGVGNHCLCDLARGAKHAGDVLDVIDALGIAGHEQSDGGVRVGSGFLFGSCPVPEPDAGDDVIRHLVHEAEPFAPEEVAAGGPDVPVAAQEPFPFHEREGLEIGDIGRVTFEQEFVVRDLGGDERDAFGGGIVAELRDEFLRGVRPCESVVNADKVAEHAGAFGDGQAGDGVKPPLDEVAEP